MCYYNATVVTDTVSLYPHCRVCSLFKTILLFAAIVALSPLAIDMYLPAMPAIASDFGVPLGVIQGSLSSYLIGFALGQLLHGPLSDQLGRKPLVIFGLGLFALASLGCAWVESAELFLVLRVVQALGGAAGGVIINALITDRFRGTEAARVRSLIIVVMTLAPMLAPTLGGGLLYLFGWQSIFLVLAGWALLALVWAARSLPASQSSSRSRLSWKAVFTGYRGMLADRNVWPWLLGMAANSAAFFAFLTGSSYLYVEILGISAQQFGLYFAANVLLMMLGAAFNGRLVRVFGIARVLRRAQKIQLIAFAGLGLAVWQGWYSLWGVVPFIALFIGCNAWVFPNAGTLFMEHNRHRAGTASALMGGAQWGLGAVSSTIVAAGSQIGPAVMLLAMAGFGLFSFIMVGLALRQNQPHPTTDG